MLDYRYERKKIITLTPDPDNPRKMLPIGHYIRESLKKNIQKFSCLQPPVFNEQTGYLIAGHLRVSILDEIGVKETEVCIVNLPPAEARQLMIGFNKIMGEWDKPKLAHFFEDWEQDPNFDYSVTGFDHSEVSQILDRYSEAEFHLDIETPPMISETDTVITKPGDLIELGQHRILCADCTEAANMDRLFEGKKAVLLDTDFPYGVGYTGGSRPNQSGEGKWDVIANDDLKPEEYRLWMKKAMGVFDQFLSPGGVYYLWQGTQALLDLFLCLREIDYHVSCQIIWLKPINNVPLTFGDYSFRSEQAIYGFKKGAPHYFGGDPTESNVWEIKRDSSKTYIHPNQKPIELRKRSIRNSSRRGEIVCDPFLGSGSAIYACEALGRRCFGMEIEPKFLDGLVKKYIFLFGTEKVSKDVLERYGWEVPDAKK